MREVTLLLSMTGFGAARRSDTHWAVEIEARTVNNRHFKLNARVSEPYAALESEIERLARDRIRRGTVQLSVRVERPKRADDYRLNTTALQSYHDQLVRIFDGVPVDPVALLNLPGVVEDHKRDATDPRDDWPALSDVIEEALTRLQESRRLEGRAMSDELTALVSAFGALLEEIVVRVPAVVIAYQARLTERVRTLVQDQGVILEPRDLAREVAILAERADVAEEITRLRAHLTRFYESLDDIESPGRKLEFIVQEMGRETNTIGSKANDVDISRCVVDMKGILEKVRELVQNVE